MFVVVWCLALWCVCVLCYVVEWLMTSAISCPLWSSVYECQTECGIFVMYCMQVVYPCQLFCSAWICCLEEVYKCCNCDIFSVVNVYLDHLKFCVVCIGGRRYVCCSECNVVSNECNEPTSLPCATYRHARW